MSLKLHERPSVNTDVKNSQKVHDINTTTNNNNDNNIIFSVRFGVKKKKLSDFSPSQI